jgi:hypothetical protein
MRLRRLTVAILMLLMLTPSMVCVMAVCPEKAQAATEKPTPPCHGGEEKSPASGPMFMGDCTLNDLGQASTFDLPLPVLALLFITFVLPVTLFKLPSFTKTYSSGVDPPPKGRASFRRLLITQRILQ